MASAAARLIARVTSRPLVRRFGTTKVRRGAIEEHAEELMNPHWVFPKVYDTRRIYVSSFVFAVFLMVGGAAPYLEARRYMLLFKPNKDE